MKKASLVETAFEHDVPIFCPAFSDSSAGFGLVLHQVKRPKAHLSIDSVKDFRELTDIKIAAPASGLLMIGGGVPKNFIQDTVICAEILGKDVPMHQYAVQITVADARDGAAKAADAVIASVKKNGVDSKDVKTMQFRIDPVYDYGKNAGMPRITGYTVTSIPAGGIDSDAGTGATTHTITGLANGTAYSFTVVATNAVGAGSASAASNSVTPVARNCWIGPARTSAPMPRSTRGPTAGLPG